MKLIVTIPAYNEAATIADVIREVPRSIPGIDCVEVLVVNDGSSDDTVAVSKSAGADHVISHAKNRGLALTFKDALNAAVERGADIIVNTDADNHYNQSRIADLVKPILEHTADIVIGNRDIEHLGTMPFLNRYGNRIGSFITTRIAGIPRLDVSSGFRAYSKEAALRMFMYSGHTYTHTTLINAVDQRLAITEVVIPARKVTRKSRLIPSIPHFIFNAGSTIVRNIILFKPLRFFSVLGAVIFLPGFALGIRFLYFYFTGSGQGHIQSLIFAAVLMLIGFQVGMIGLIASAIGWNRKVLEELLYQTKKQQLNK